MKLTRISNEISRFSIAHWLVGSVSENSKAFISVADGWVSLELDAKITAPEGTPILYLPYILHPTIQYLPPGYASDTGSIYRSGQFFRTGPGRTDFWFRRQWSWYIGKGEIVTQDMLEASPPPCSLARFLGGWYARNKNRTSLGNHSVGGGVYRDAGVPDDRENAGSPLPKHHVFATRFRSIQSRGNTSICTETTHSKAGVHIRNNQPEQRHSRVGGRGYDQSHAGHKLSHDVGHKLLHGAGQLQHLLVGATCA